MEGASERAAFPSPASPAPFLGLLPDHVLQVLGLLPQHPQHRVGNTGLLALVDAFELKMEQKSQLIHKDLRVQPTARSSRPQE